MFTYSYAHLFRLWLKLYFHVHGEEPSYERWGVEAIFKVGKHDERSGENFVFTRIVEEGDRRYGKKVSLLIHPETLMPLEVTYRRDSSIDRNGWDRTKDYSTQWEFYCPSEKEVTEVLQTQFDSLKALAIQKAMQEIEEERRKQDLERAEAMVAKVLGEETRFERDIQV